MPESRRRRRWRIALAIAVLAIVTGALLFRHYSRPEALTALLAANAKRALGAELSLAGPARFGFVPDLHLVLPQPSLGDAGAPFLSAEHADVVVPWSILWQDDRYEIRRIELASPRVDLDALARWLASRPAGAESPDVRFTLVANDATLIANGKPVASGVDLSFASVGDVIDWAKHAGPSTPLLPPLAGTAKAAVVEFEAVRLEGVRIETRDDKAGTPVR
ncbi:MAG TPA: hypothetical protein VJ696_08050 [Rhodanobacteraceae bacterium]|nr:hypothetical protein [Rhodanobacteraceae bacterium]